MDDRPGGFVASRSGRPTDAVDQAAVGGLGGRHRTRHTHRNAEMSGMWISLGSSSAARTQERPSFATMVSRTGKLLGLTCIALGAIVVAPTCGYADENGISAWLPGSFGSLAAVPQDPGWTLGTVYYHTSLW